ncbi:hypothetical protein EYF80_023468 [Liparis tanakae]|uniref:Uncharacterized protein n=1 Tax=Liparis tanakae TaxID=230148 RepID=A0A4Z2HNJ8_9TELE|nr:hypothetical protein EYF80_023468 [Liparis tanakae]
MSAASMRRWAMSSDSVSRLLRRPDLYSWPTSSLWRLSFTWLTRKCITAFVARAFLLPLGPGCWGLAAKERTEREQRWSSHHAGQQATMTQPSLVIEVDGEKMVTVRRVSTFKILWVLNTQN